MYTPAVVAALVPDARATPRLHVAHRTTGRRIFASPTRTVRGVETDRGVITARFVVNAMGAWADLDGDDGVHIRVEPRQGVVAVTTSHPPSDLSTGPVWPAR